MTALRPKKYIIRTSDRGTFKRCRELWNFKSPLRRNLQPVEGPKPLEFGIAVHSGLQVWYDPDKWYYPEREVVKQLAIGAFNRDCNEQEQRRKDTGLWDETVEADFGDRRQLGAGILSHYFEWSGELDQDWEPVYTEVEFEVPVWTPNGVPYRDLNKYPYSTHSGFVVGSKDGQLYIRGIPVFYQGRLDVVMHRKSDDTYWIWDHKTAAQFRENLDWLDMDPQVGSYAWALWMQLGLAVEGVIYNQLRKTVPKPPKELKAGGFSVNKQQDTTYEVYKRTLEGAGIPIVQYSQMLEHLKEKGNRFFRRIPVHRTQTELEIIGNNIGLEAIDMLTNPSIYPNPTDFNCYGCSFKMPCLAKQDGSDFEHLLRGSGLYVVSS